MLNRMGTPSYLLSLLEINQIWSKTGKCLSKRLADSLRRMILILWRLVLKLRIMLKK